MATCLLYLGIILKKLEMKQIIIKREKYKEKFIVILVTVLVTKI